MLTVEGPFWCGLIAAGCWLLMEASVHVREFLRDLRFHRSRREHGEMPETWKPSRKVTR